MRIASQPKVSSNHFNKINDTIERINAFISTNNLKDNYALLTGKSGILLYKAYYNKIYNTNYFDLAPDIAAMFSVIPSIIPSYSFCTGISGMIWAYKHLIQYGLIDSDEDAMGELDGFIEQCMLTDMEYGNYDYLHGALGVAWTFLEFNKEGKYSASIEKCITTLERIASTIDEKSIFWIWTNSHGVTGISNFGLSHGMSSILILLSECFRQGIEQERCHRLLTKALQHLRVHKRDKSLGNSLYPNTNMTDDLKRKGRLSWCYGDLGIALALWKVGEDTCNPALIEEATELVLLNAHRRDLKDNEIADAPICHGASGLARIFKHFYSKTGNLALRETYLYWMEQTLQFDEKKDLTGYRAYRTDRPSELLPTLLEGVAGIGLVLMSELTEEKLHWDRCLLLT